MESRIVDVAGRARVRVYEGGDGPDLLFLHGVGGLLPNDPFLARLAERFRVTAPLLPGFEDSEGEENIREMLDFTLHAFDVWETLGLDDPLVVGHSMGGMIAAEMAAVSTAAVNRLALICPAGLWMSEHELPDLFAALPFELPELLFHDPAAHGALLSAGGDLNDPEFLTEFMVDNARRLGMAGKILFPIPDRGLADRLYRVRARTRIIWGESDRLIPAVYGDRFASAIADARLTIIAEAGHMVPYERTEAVIDAISSLET